MILHGIETRNFMSLRECAIHDLDNHLNFLVGPNGSGKTSSFRVLKVIRDALSFNRSIPFDQLCTRGVSPQKIDLTIDVEFNTIWEQEFITSFLCASLSRPYELPQILAPILPQPMAPITSEGHIAFSEWLLHIFLPETLPFLFRGKLHLSYRSENYENLRINYTFIHNSIPITISIRPIDSVLLRGNIPENIPGGYSPMNGLLEFFQSVGAVQDIVNLLTRQAYPANNSIDPVACLLFLSEKRVMLGIDMNGQQNYLPAQRRFAKLSDDLNFASITNQSFRFGYVLQKLLKRALVFTNNLRVPVEDITKFGNEVVAKSEIDLDDEREIPLLLYRLKIGDYAERMRFQRIQGSFTELLNEDSGFDITARFENPQQPDISVTIQITDLEGEIPLTYHGAGVWEALMLSTILDESDGRVIFLDEPASNLHAGMQHRLINILRAVPGQVIIVTHSAQMLPTDAEDFYKVRRMQKTRNETLVKSLDKSGPLRSGKIEKELNRSSDLAGLLFTDGVILVEGETEIGAFDEWFTKSALSQGKAFSDLNLELYWVGGKANLPFHMQFLSEFGIPWVIICDGDALPVNKDRNYQLWETLRDLKRINNVPDVTASFDEIKVLAEQGGVYTANSSAIENFEDILEVKGFKEKNKVPGEGKARQGRYIAERIPCPSEVERILRLAMQQLGKQK